MQYKVKIESVNVIILDNHLSKTITDFIPNMIPSMTEKTIIQDVHILLGIQLLIIRLNINFITSFDQGCLLLMVIIPTTLIMLISKNRFKNNNWVALVISNIILAICLSMLSISYNNELIIIMNGLISINLSISFVKETENDIFYRYLNNSELCKVTFNILLMHYCFGFIPKTSIYDFIKYNCIILIILIYIKRMIKFIILHKKYGNSDVNMTTIINFPIVLFYKD